MPNAITSFKGTLASTTLDHPFPFTPQPDNLGFLLGVGLQTRKPYRFHPWNSMDAGDIDSTSFMAVGNKGRGKTALGKLILMLLTMAQSDGQRIKVSYDNHKNNDGQPEVAELNRFFGVESTDLAKYKLNIIDPALGMEYWEILNLIIVLLVDLIEHPLTRYQAFAYQVGLIKLTTKWNQAANIRSLAGLVARLDEADVAAYYAAQEADLTQYIQVPDSLVEELKKPLNIYQDMEAFRQDCSTASTYLLQLVDGRIGRTFGDEHSIAGVLSQRAVSLDYSHLSDEAMPLVLGMIAHIRKSAERRGDLRFMAHARLEDENYKLWRYLTYATGMSDEDKQIRNRSPYIHRNIHQLEDYDTVGDIGTQQRSLALNSINGVAGWFIFRSTDSALRQLQSRLKFSNVDRETLAKLPRGCCGVKLGTRPINYIQLPLTAAELKVSLTNEALRKFTSRGKKRGLKLR